MLIKESTLRRIIREEARRSLREALTAPSDTPADVTNTAQQWKDAYAEPFLNFVTSIAASATQIGGGMGVGRLSAAAKSLTVYGSKSKYAKFAVNKTAKVTNTPPGIDPDLGPLACVLASLAEEKQITDWNGATQILLDKTSQQDILSRILIKALGGVPNRSTQMLDNINKLGATLVPGGGPAQAPMAVDPGAGTFLSSELSGNVPSNVKIGRLSYTLPANTIAQITPSLLPVAKGQKILAKGSKGADVATLQQLLNLIAQQNPSVLTQIESDSDFGNATLAAVIAYQKAAGIVVDGKVGQQTLAQIIGRKSSMTGQAGDKGNYFSGLQAATGTTPAGVAGVNSNRIIATKPTQNEGRRRR